MEKMSQTMEKLTNSIADGFTMLQRMMAFQQPTPMYHPQTYSPFVMQGSSSSGMSIYRPTPSDPSYPPTSSDPSYPPTLSDPNYQ